MKENPKSYIDKIAVYTGSNHEFEKLSLRPVHVNYIHNGLLLRHSKRRILSAKMIQYTKILFLLWWHKIMEIVKPYSLIAIGNRLPEKRISKEAYIDPEYL